MTFLGVLQIAIKQFRNWPFRNIEVVDFWLKKNVLEKLLKYFQALLITLFTVSLMVPKTKVAQKQPPEVLYEKTCS